MLRTLAQIQQPSRKASVTVKHLVSIVYGDSFDSELRQTAIGLLIGKVLNKLAEGGEVAFEIRQKEKKWCAIV